VDSYSRTNFAIITHRRTMVASERKTNTWPVISIIVGLHWYRCRHCWVLWSIQRGSGKTIYI